MRKFISEHLGGTPGYEADYTAYLEHCEKLKASTSRLVDELCVMLVGREVAFTTAQQYKGALKMLGVWSKELQAQWIKARREVSWEPEVYDE